jgi:NADH dehydrogenase FAD-containing subunit
VPQLAQAAIHQASVVAENIVREMTGQPAVAYRFPHMHAIVPLGGAWGIAEVFGIRFRGYVVWPLRLAADIRYFVKTLPWRSAWKLIRAPLSSFRRNNL